MSYGEVVYFQSHEKRNQGHEDVTKDGVQFEIYATQFLCYQRVFFLTVEYQRQGYIGQRYNVTS
jgi:hypothetical protein